MKHYLMKLLDNPKLEDPVKDAPDVHKHFTRYSKGYFDGPTIKISQTKAKISLWCSYEYEDEALRIATRLYPEDIINVTGAIIGAIDFTPLMKKIGFGKEFKPVKSSGKTANYSAVIKSEVPISKDLLQTLSIDGTPYVYSLLSFTSLDKTIDLKIKKKPPRPSSKNPDDAAGGSKLKFCILKIPNVPENLKMIIDAVAQDFIDEIPLKWKSIIIKNTYKITNLIIPSRNLKLSSRQIRLHTLREGILHRTATIDSIDHQNTINFKV